MVQPPGVNTRRMRRLLWLILQNSTAMPFSRFGNIYKCFFCHNTFPKASQLKFHTATHTDSNHKFRIVNRCGSGLKSSIKLDISELKCKLCDNEFNCLKNFLTHLKEIHKENAEIEALKHIDGFKLSDDRLQCLHCNETFEFFNPLLLHTVRMHKPRPLICELCGVSFSTKRNLSRHIQNAHETNQNTFKCRHCSKVFKAEHKREDHEGRIHCEKARQCHICGEILGSTFTKVSHLATVHNFRETEFKCENCPKIFRFQSQLAQHNKRVHLKEKTKVCDICGDKFFDNQLLALHMVRHSDSKPFECGVCKKKFPRKKGFTMHMRIHTGDKRCVCKVCGKAFVQTTSLKLHVRVHHGIEKK